MNSFKGYMSSRILNICIQMTKVKINCPSKTPFLGHFWVYFVDFHSEVGKMAFFRYDFQILQHFLHKKWSKCNSLEVILQSSDFLNTDVRETLLVSCNVSYAFFQVLGIHGLVVWTICYLKIFIRAMIGP